LHRRAPPSRNYLSILRRKPIRLKARLGSIRAIYHGKFSALVGLGLARNLQGICGVLIAT